MFERATPTWSSIHTALAGCDEEALDLPEQTFEFQSTQPSQAVTAIRPTLIRWSLFQSTQPSQAVTKVSLMALTPKQFQSTQPSQAVTSKTSEIWEGIKISIHTALAGCDPNVAR